jgi:hypothetical protein
MKPEKCPLKCPIGRKKNRTATAARLPRNPRSDSGQVDAVLLRVSRQACCGNTKALPIAFGQLVKPGTFELRFDANHARIVLNLEKWLCNHRA